MKKILLLFGFLFALNLNSMSKKCSVCGNKSTKTYMSNGKNKYITVHNWEFHLTRAKELVRESNPEACEELIKIFNAVKYLPLKESLIFEAIDLLLKIEPLPDKFLKQEAAQYIQISEDGKIQVKKHATYEEAVKAEQELFE